MNKSSSEEKLEARIRELEAEIQMLRSKSPWDPYGETVRVPEPFRPLFDIAQDTVRQFFSLANIDPTHASIEVSGERYVLLRASSLSVDFLTTIKNLYADYGEDEAFQIGRTFLFDIAHVIGMEDAKNFHKKMDVTDPIAKLSAGPVHFAYAGWAFVDINPESAPQPNEDFFLKYDHPYSFEADSWIASGRKSNHPVCIMNSGYSSGWCEESFGMPLTAVELTCRAAGDDRCTFIMAPPSRIEEHLGRLNPRRKTVLKIPSFFERKRIEEEMRAARKKAEESDQMKSEFLANMSHEIRTPMNGVIGMTELVLESELDDTQREYLSAARTSAESLLRIINDVLDFSKIEAGAITLDLAPFELRGMLSETLKPFFLDDQTGTIEIFWNVQPDVPDRFVGDAGRIRQVIVNLVGNSIKFTEQGEIEVSAKLAKAIDKNDPIHLQFQIRDTGIGIPPEKLNSVFDAFAQVDMSSTKNHSGTGLGLTISKELVQLLGGKIWCANNPSGGCSFYFEIPLQNDESTNSQSELPTVELPDTASELPRLNILLAEDSLINQKLAIAILTKWGHDVTLAKNGREAVEHWQQSEGPFDVILMDVLMPELDGIDATKQIRKLEQGSGKRIPIIAVTAQAIKGDRETCIAAGMDGYISKPIRREELQNAIRAHIVN